MNQDLESLVQDANSQFEGSYLFSGTKTDTAPIAVTRDAQGNIQNITYQGSDTDVTYPVGQGRTAPVSVTAQAAYMNVLTAVKQLRDDLNNTQGLSSQDQQTALSNDLGAINTAQNSFTAQAAEVGSYQSQLTSLSTQMQTSLTNAQAILSNYQDADIAQISVQLAVRADGVPGDCEFRREADAASRSLQLPDCVTAKTGGRETGFDRLRGPF